MARSNIRYEVLPSEEQNVPAEPVSMAMVIAPPGYAESAVLEHQGDIPAYGPAKLPNYEDATTLPSYEEAERSKLEQDISNGASALTDCEGGRLTGADNISEIAIGSDGMFICTFLISFLFNWLGFLLSLCLSNTVAGRCGALSGLGLSIVKWVVIVKHNNWGNNVADADSWLWWLLVLCGFLLFVRGSVQYVRVKYEWARLSGHLRHFRLL
ncbi:NEDD4 family-interacting protein 1-like isoform X1 [Biomphalaria glabrata]|uniref:NEDD4 family-interacting protein 1-like isoform X1 n=1 Tax=Biomphalaria glabrata TaxID=6526 RepID=A0A9W3B7D7_BIOGL|nr:NEDD4 family-interacting protein 1-like isoform X1 [Biomphalaria glabrata]